MNIRFVFFLILGALLVGGAEYDLRKRIFSPVRKLDRFWVDFCIGNSRDKIADPSVTMVRITEEYEPVSLALNGEAVTSGEKNLTRLDYAAILYAIGKLQPKAVSFIPAPVFSSDSVLNQTDIYPLKDAALQLPKMTLGTVVSDQGKPGNPNEAAAYPALTTNGDISALPVIARTVRPSDSELLANGEPAFFSHESVDPLQSGNPRILLIANQGGKVVPGFVLASVARQKGVSMDQITVNLDGKKPNIQVGDLYTIPISADGTMALPSHGGLTHSMYDKKTGEDGQERRTYHFASLKVEDVALAVEKSDAIAKVLLEEFSGKFESISRNLVLVGFDRRSDRTVATLNEELLSPMTAAARAIATIQGGRYLVRWPGWIRGIVYGVIGVMGLLLIGFKRRTFFLPLLVTILSVAAMVFVFRETLSWTPPVAIFGLFGLMIFPRIFRWTEKGEERSGRRN